MRSAMSLLAGLGTLFLVACGTSSIQHVPMPDLEVPVQYTGSCRLYLVREGGEFAAERPLTVSDRGFAIGALAAGGYLCWERPAGEADLRFVLEASADGPALGGSRVFPVKAHHIYYAVVRFPDSGARPVLDLVSEETGRLLVADASPADVSE